MLLSQRCGRRSVDRAGGMRAARGDVDAAMKRKLEQDARRERARLLAQPTTLKFVPERCPCKTFRIPSHMQRTSPSVETSSSVSPILARWYAIFSTCLNKAKAPTSKGCRSQVVFAGTTRGQIPIWRQAHSACAKRTRVESRSSTGCKCAMCGASTVLSSRTISAHSREWFHALRCLTTRTFVGHAARSTASSPRE